uniref:YY1 associated protein 1 n=1 Tax=Homo sapiens TaxID=9606 RepID=A0AAQ5BIC5_HUMAN
MEDLFETPMNFPVCQSKWLGSWPQARFSCIQSYFQCVP